MGNSRDAAVGDVQGLIQSVIDNSSGDPLKNPWRYYTQALNPTQVSQGLYGNMSRQMGDVGRSVGAQAAAYGVTNPYSWIQHAQAGVSNQYANQFADLPFKIAQQNLMANQGNFENLYKLLALKAGLAPARSGGFSDWGPGALQAGATIGSAALSDRRLKRNIIHLYQRSDGINVYEYNFVWGSPRYTGVMADEVEQIIPSAVSIHPSGYKMVDYSQLG